MLHVVHSSLFLLAAVSSVPVDSTDGTTFGDRALNYDSRWQLVDHASRPRPRERRRRSVEPSAQRTSAESAVPAAQQAPGQFDVDEASAEQALERTLVREGALLLPAGWLEIEPGLTFTRREQAAPFAFADSGPESVVAVNLRRNIIDLSLDLRLGLPFDAQAEIALPYRFVDQSALTTVGFDPAGEVDDNGSGFGDLRVGLSKTLAHEGNGWFDLVARLTWDTGLGDTSDGGVALGGGFDELRASLSVLKRQDPLAFTGSVGYERSFENDGRTPGDEVAISVGVSLAASPDTSLRFGLEQAFVDDTEINGTRIEGSDRVVGSFTIGAASIIAPRTLLNVSTAIGLTDDASDYSLGLAVSRRFEIF